MSKFVYSTKHDLYINLDQVRYIEKGVFHFENNEIVVDGDLANSERLENAMATIIPNHTKLRLIWTCECYDDDLETFKEVGISFLISEIVGWKINAAYSHNKVMPVVAGFSNPTEDILDDSYGLLDADDMVQSNECGPISLAAWKKERYDAAIRHWELEQQKKKK